MANSDFLFLNVSQNDKEQDESRRRVASYLAKRRIKLVGRPHRTHKKVTSSSAQGLVGWRHRSSNNDTNLAEKGGRLSLSAPSTSSTEPVSRLQEIEEGTTLSDDSSDQLAILARAYSHVVAAWSTPKLAFDSYGGNLTLSEQTRRVLYYFNTVWMPSDRHIPTSCHIAGYSPVSPYDLAVSRSLVSESVLTTNKVHLNALLAAAVYRMRFFDGLSLGQGVEPEIFTVKAIRALREYIGRPRDTSHDNRLVLDIGFLAVTEFYAPSPTRTLVFWGLLTDHIVACGGLHRIDGLPAYFVLAIDLSISEITLTPLGFDFLKTPGLLGLTRPILNINQAFTADCPISQAIKNSNPRLICQMRQHNLFTCILGLIHCLPGDIIPIAASYINQYRRGMYAIICATADPRDKHTPVQASTAAMEADIYFCHARHTAYALWIWEVAVSFAPPCPSGDWLGYLLPMLGDGPSRHISNISESIYEDLRSADNLFAGTTWKIRDTARLWVCALGKTTAKSVVLQALFANYLATVCAEMEIFTAQELHAQLRAPSQLPLDRMAGFDIEALSP